MHLFCKQEIPTPGSSPPAVILADRDSDSTSPSPSFSPISDFEQVLLSDRSSKPSSDTSDDTKEPSPPADDCTIQIASFQAEEPTTITTDVDIPSSSPIQELSSFDALHQWSGFKIVGDNIDKNVRPSFQRLTHQTKSLHFFHSYAVKDRVNLSSASDTRKPRPSDYDYFVVSVEDWNWFKEICQVLVSR